MEKYFNEKRKLNSDSQLIIERRELTASENFVVMC